MRTLWITNDLPPRAGGIEQFVGNLLDRHAGDAVVVGPTHDDAEAHDDAVPWEVVRAPGAVLPTPQVLQLVRDVAARHLPDVVVLGAAWPLAELAGALRRDPGAPVVAISHGLEAGLAGRGLGRPLLARTTKHLDGLTTISAWTEARLVPHVACPITRVPPGVDVERFRPDVDGAGMRARWGVPLGAEVVGCVSRLVARKGQDALLDAWPRVSRRHPAAWLVLVGSGPLEDSLRRRAATLERAVVTGGVSWDDLPAAHAAFDVFAMPCRTRLFGTDVEGLGIVYLEAQASGVPVVAGTSGGAPETVRQGVTGLVVDGQDRRQLVRALDDLLDDPDRRAAMGRAGREHAVDRWAWPSIVERFDAELQRAVAAHRHVGPRR